LIANCQHPGYLSANNMPKHNDVPKHLLLLKINKFYIYIQIFNKVVRRLGGYADAGKTERQRPATINYFKIYFYFTTLSSLI